MIKEKIALLLGMCELNTDAVTSCWTSTGTQQSTLPLNVGRSCGFWCQHHFIRWISCRGVPAGMQSSAGRSPFLTHWQIWSSLLASEQKHDVTVAVTKMKDLSSFSVPTHLRTVPPLWGWPTPRSRSCRRRTSQWRPCVCSPGAQVPCSSECRLLSPWLTALYGSSCETPPLWVCSKLEILLNPGLQSRIDMRRLHYRWLCTSFGIRRNCHWL